MMSEREKIRAEAARRMRHDEMLHPTTPDDVFRVPGSVGIYVAYVDDGGPHMLFAERKLLVWDGKLWSFPMSDQVFRHRVYGWIGPLAPMQFEFDTQRG